MGLDRWRDFGEAPGEVAALIARSIVVDRTAPAPAAAVAVA